jgi:hypothetical protein
VRTGPTDAAVVPSCSALTILLIPKLQAESGLPNEDISFSKKTRPERTRQLWPGDHARSKRAKRFSLRCLCARHYSNRYGNKKNISGQE